MDQFETSAMELLDFISASPSCYHAADNFRLRLLEADFTELREFEVWDLIPGQNYFTVRSDSSVIAFKIPENRPVNFQIIASHSDSPSFKLKENPEMLIDGHYVELNVEKYGGMLCAPWFDRPLSIAGRIAVSENGRISTRLVNFDYDLVMLPSLAIHMNREANTGMPYKIQKDMLPLIGDESSLGSLKDMLADEAGTVKDNIAGADLFLYDRSRQCIWGANREYMSSGRLDDLMCAFASLKAFLGSENAESISLCCLFDNEEVGSRTKQGADSTFLSDVMERIASSLRISREEYLRMIASGFMISADNGHAVHPNNMDKNDPTNHAFMNHGVLIKHNANQKYTTDALSAAVFRNICSRAGVPVQNYVNHSDVAGGSTLGNISNGHISINTVDTGAAQLAMHSPYETAGVKDFSYLVLAMKEFYNTTLTRDSSGSYILN